ncbi:NAD(P)-dependent oxidoreductase [Cytophagales bacterium LB-30]|uniref:Saccharopine dehydrogenase [NAD(+), L-lysine-forming] n=1 Tax=Shiella aurantiaca TaxID=3058365 RepID=A0ABT8F2D5_9BACT|nr:NAD(P)-dependent oxidoreductase [Shiella aurantiaca]MDN4164570.1 NAD(P)-dependent oxidoreductase [Shiella aurantiaca]
MSTIKIGLIREGKIPVDRRVPITPPQAAEIQEKFPNVQVLAQTSQVRCYKDEEYSQQGIALLEDDLHGCDILMGVKEVPIKDLVENKTYFFFSHTIKKQAYNRHLLLEILHKNIRLIDYECLTNTQGERIVAFGRYAGLVGAYNGIMTYGRRENLFDIRRARDCFDLNDLKTEYKKVQLPAIKIAVTGSGRVAKGAMEVLDGMGIRKVSVEEYLGQTFAEPVYVQLSSKHYHLSKDGSPFSSERFYSHPAEFKGNFMPFAQVTDLLIACAFWHPAAPVLFTREEMQQADFKIKVIADVTCDIEGSIPSTLRPSTIDDPVYDYNPATGKEEIPYSSKQNVTVMAIDNLPCELPRNASHDFGRDLIDKVLPHLLGSDAEEVIKRATIAENGRLTKKYAYLADYVAGV